MSWLASSKKQKRPILPFLKNSCNLLIFLLFFTKNRNQLKQAVKKSDSDLVERTMLEDKIRATDWEATNEAIEEQVARESYFQWLRDNERRQAAGNSKSATVTSADLKAATEAATAATTAAVTSSPSRAKALKEEESTRAARSSPKPGCSHSTSSEPAHFAVSFLFTIFYLKYPTGS